jgi:hypothetical protein
MEEMRENKKEGGMKEGWILAVKFDMSLKVIP